MGKEEGEMEEGEMEEGEMEEEEKEGGEVAKLVERGLVECGGEWEGCGCATVH